MTRQAGAAERSGLVEEMQGLYGPYAFSEKLLQRIWLLGLFDTKGALLVDGRRLEVLAPGRWNLLGGPDFRGARLRLDGREVVGDVEVHFHSADWQRHGHGGDPAYDGVVLHVVLYEPKAPCRPLTSAGRPIPELVLMPWLHCHLEEFAADAAVEALTGRDSVRLAEQLLEVPLPERLAQLCEAASKRWEQKVRFARLRIERLGWEGACHHTALEILGYRFNRAAMLTVAERLPLAAWRSGVEIPDALALAEGFWCRQGVRPANAPGKRLAQYATWVRAVPEWPARWEEFAEGADWAAADGAPEDVLRRRRVAGLGKWLKTVAEGIVGGSLGGGRLNTMVNNGLLPLLAARAGIGCFPWWFIAPAGEASVEVQRAVRLAGICGRGALPTHEGAVQGLMQMALERPVGFA